MKRKRLGTARNVGILSLFCLFLCALFVGFGNVRTFTPSLAEESQEARVTGVSFGASNINLLVFNLSGTDYPTVSGTDETTFNYEVSYDRLTSISFFEKVKVDGKTLQEIYNGVDGNSTKYYINLFQVSNTFALHLPGYSASATLSEIVIESGCQFPAYNAENGCYTVSGDVRFVKEDGVWKQKLDYATSEVTVNGLIYGNWNLNYLLITLDGTDYPPNGGDPDLHNYKIDESVLASMDFLDKIRLDGSTLREIYAKNASNTYRDYVLNLFQMHGTIGFPIPGYYASSVIKEIVIEKGCQFPSYEYVTKGGTARCFMTTKEVIGVKGTDSSYTLFEACDESKPAVLDDSITATVTSEGYQFDIRLNRTGEQPADAYVEDSAGECVSINGVTLAEINAEEKYATAKWQYLGGRYYLQIVLSAEYEGDAEILNEDDYFAGNYITLDRALTLPNGKALGTSFILHVYRTNSITEIVDEDLQEESICVENISAGYDVNGDFNIWITFSEEISAGMRLFLASPDSFGKTQLKPMNSQSIVYYDDELAKNFISGGYKSALLDKVLVNGVSLGEWLAYDSTPGYLTAVMVHYGQVTQKTMSIVCDLADDGSWATDIFNSATEAYKNGGLTVSVQAGMRFPTGKVTCTDADYQYINGAWKKKTTEFGVYYAGKKVGNEQTVESEIRANLGDIHVEGNEAYTFEETRTGDVVRFIVKANGKQVFAFSVKETIETSSDDEQGFGCSATAQSSLAIGLAAFAIGAIALICKRRENDA